MNLRILLLFSFCFLWAGATQSAEGADTQSTPSYVIAFAQDDMSNDWRAAQVEAVRAELSHYPSIRFIHTDARGKTSQQALDIEQLAAQGIDLLITSPRDAKSLTPVISRVYRQGIPVVLLTRRILSDDYTAYVGADNRMIAQQAARFLGGHLKGSGRILVIQGLPTATTAMQRTSGFVDELSKESMLQIAAIKPADYLRSKAVRAVDEAIREGLVFDAIYAQSDSMATGARLALKQAGISPSSIPIVGIDYIREAQQAILAGEQLGSFVFPTCGQEGAEIAMKILEGKSVPKNSTVQSRLITIENASKVDPIF
jgi:ribose transport system substrate-binding protein